MLPGLFGDVAKIGALHRRVGAHTLRASGREHTPFGQDLLNIKDQMRAFTIVVQLLGLFSVVLMGVSAWFTWGKKSKVS